ncbi:MAG: branched-chain amino acid ABC transporter permease [Candidatus Dormibacteraeota bacterium]|nr:branched-chain amino acid ABC transporter permease [Candidatus Dormibacteraeota bacterium]
MQSFAQQVVSGVASGAIYASLALALVLIYRAMDVANFAQGEMAMFATFVAYTLITQFHLPYLVAFVLTILLAFAGGVIVERAVVRPFEGAPVLTLVIVTLALFSIVNGLAGLIWGYVFKTFDSPFPARSVQVGGVFVGIQDLGVIAVTLVVLAVVFSFFRYTRLGLAMRAAALYPESSRLLGVRTSRMLALGWGLAAAVGAVSGMMVAPIVFLDPNMMQPVLLFAFAAAVLGGIESPVGSVIGGVIVGVLLALVGTYLPGGQNLRIPFGLIVIVAVLLFRPAGLFGRREMKRV